MIYRPLIYFTRRDFKKYFINNWNKSIHQTCDDIRMKREHFWLLVDKCNIDSTILNELSEGKYSNTKTIED